MDDPNDLMRTVLLALLVGVAVPLSVQLFLTLRALSKAITSLDKRLGESLTEITDLLKATRPSPPVESGQLATLIATAAGPALLAAVRALRAHSGEHAAAAHGNGETSKETRP